MTLWFQEKVDVLESHEILVRSVCRQFAVPAVLRLRTYIKPRAYRRVRLSRDNIFFRDNHTCQYCGQHFHPRDLTLDHVMPVSRGGPKSWKNLVTACHKCNHKKGSRTPSEANMPLLSKPAPLPWTPQFDLMTRIREGDELWIPYLGPKQATA